MVFKNPICSLPDVGGCGGGSEGSVSTVTRHGPKGISQQVSSSACRESQ